ncbi:Fic family protein [Candidatus Nanohalococcus occultus]|uniref:Fic family protein n=1 Tax=Candidatus Nanohalococcus occultus TaxID=2978047 RepID=UPI0039E166E0
MKDIENALNADCSRLEDLISYTEILAINMYVTDTERFNQTFGGTNGTYSAMMDSITDPSPAYRNENDTDYFKVHEAGTLQNLLETEFLYLCKKNSDIIHLSAVLMHRIASGHPFGEGNKRTAYLSACVLLINYQAKILKLETVSIPSLDQALRESLGDIAEDHSSISPEQLGNQYRKSVIKELKEIMKD